MKQYQVNRAYGALNKLSEMQLPIRDAHKVFMLAQQLKSNYDFEIEQEKKIFERNHARFMPNGEMVFDDEQDAIRFKDEMTELGNIDVDLDIQPVTISIDSLDGYTMTPSDIMALSGFVDFE